MNIEALFNISYGLYIVTSGNVEKGNGFISNTVFQVTAEPPKFALCCNKNNYTSEIIKKTNIISVSILQKQASSEIFGRFGYKSGRDFDKMKGMDIKYGETGVPIVLNESIAYLECKLIETIDVGTHLLFIVDLINAEIIDNSLEPLTYSYYREVKKGVAPKNAPTYIDKSKINNIIENNNLKKFKCTACGYIYDETVESNIFVNLHNDWKCPICGCDKECFILL
ncbi:MAG: hypothetical protein A2X12_11840 [Bacteroidetes bacterium GWE2_29_8]|nr:MAG: hypothetical protein A2X12_11840 [Bacteroidetes bacterium GWE2_29_8]OFY20767.1 MAG: hypothetical protein A2X02_09745 [Bacteroidetes bacterium GWF2_29_10]